MVSAGNYADWKVDATSCPSCCHRHFKKLLHGAKKGVMNLPCQSRRGATLAALPCQRYVPTRNGRNATMLSAISLRAKANGQLHYPAKPRNCGVSGVDVSIRPMLSSGHPGVCPLDHNQPMPLLRRIDRCVGLSSKTLAWSLGAAYSGGMGPKLCMIDYSKNRYLWGVSRVVGPSSTNFMFLCFTHRT